MGETMSNIGSGTKTSALEEYQTLYDKRTLLTKAEQSIEAIIYDRSMIWNASTISAFLVAYETAKNERAAASLAVAAAYMHLTPEERVLADSIYAASDDKKRRTTAPEASQ